MIIIPDTLEILVKFHALYEYCPE